MEYCTVQDCENKQKTRGCCSKHYVRLWRGDDVNEKTIFDKRTAIVKNNIAKIPLGLNAKNGYAIVDKDFAWLDKYNWHVSHGYARVSRLGSMHHMIIGKPEKGFDVDHINHNTLDNRLCNLRVISHHQNSMNHKIRNSAHGFKGITKDSGKWKAQIMFNRKHIHLGRFLTQKEAAIAYNAAAIKYFGEYANLNKV